MESVISTVALMVATGSCLVSTIALLYSVRGDRRKSGIDIRCDFAVATSIASEYPWVSKIDLQNEKDRAVTIYKIYLEIGHGIFIEIEEFREKPLILEPYGTYYQQYDPIDLYSASMRHVTGVLDKSLGRRRIVLSTSSGRHYAKRRIDTQDPMVDFLSNYASGVIVPIRLTHNGKGYGSRVQYIVTFTHDDRDDEIVPIYPDDHRLVKFRHFQLTEDAMQSKEALEAFFREQMSEKRVSFSNVSVLDAGPSREELLKEYSGSISVPYYGWFRYNIVYWAHTKWEQLRPKIKNRLFILLKKGE